MNDKCIRVDAKGRREKERDVAPWTIKFFGNLPAGVAGLTYRCGHAVRVLR